MTEESLVGAARFELTTPCTPCNQSVDGVTHGSDRENPARPVNKTGPQEPGATEEAAAPCGDTGAGELPPGWLIQFALAAFNAGASEGGGVGNFQRWIASDAGVKLLRAGAACCARQPLAEEAKGSRARSIPWTPTHPSKPPDRGQYVVVTSCFAGTLFCCAAWFTEEGEWWTDDGVQDLKLEWPLAYAPAGDISMLDRLSDAQLMDRINSEGDRS